MKSYKQIYYSIIALSLCGISFTQAMDFSHSANEKDFTSREEVIVASTLRGASDPFDALIGMDFKESIELESKLVEEVSKKGQIDVIHANGNTLLINSILFNNIPLVEVLLEKGADIRQKDGRNRTVLHAAVLKGNADLLRRFLELGASDLIEEKDIDGQSIIDVLNKRLESEEKYDMLFLIQGYRDNNSRVSTFDIDASKIDISENNFDQNVEPILQVQVSQVLNNICQDEKSSNELIDSVIAELKPWSLGSLFSKKGLLIAGGVVAGLFAAYIKYKTPVGIERAKQILIEQKEQEAKEQAE